MNPSPAPVPSGTLTLPEKILYHQIHPLKLAVDWGTTPPACYFLWRHRLGPGLAWAVIPPILASAALLRWADLAPLARRPAGRYIRRHMTPAMQALRLAGGAVLLAGAWAHRPLLIPAGLLIVLFGWGRGMLRPDHGPAAPGAGA